MPRITSSGPSQSAIALKVLERPVSDYTDDELELLIQQMEGARSMAPGPKGRSGGGSSKSPGQAEIDFDNIG